MKVRYIEGSPVLLFWCNSHERKATHIQIRDYVNEAGSFHEETPCCDPKLRGILLPCSCVNLSGVATIEEVK
jgi:hypothetical protein